MRPTRWEQECRPEPGEVPVSRCSEICSVGSRKKPRETIHSCCYDCVPCSEGEFSNITDSETCIKCPSHEWPNEKKDQCEAKIIEFLSFQNDTIASIFSFLTVFGCFVTSMIFAIFIIYRDTPIVKANNRNLSYLLLISIFLSYLSVFWFLGRPSNVTCRLRETSFGILFSVAISSLLAKTLLVFVAFKSTKPGSSWRKMVVMKLPNSIVLPSLLYYKYFLNFQFAIEEVNKNHNIFPNLTLGFHVYDACSSANKAVKSVLQILSGSGATFPNYHCTGDENIAGFIGDILSVTTVPITQILTVYGYTQISYGASDPLLSDRVLYPYHFHATQDDRVYASAVLAILKYFSWNWVGIISTAGDSGDKESQILSSFLTSNGVCIEFTAKIFPLTARNFQVAKIKSMNKKVQETVSRSSTSIIIVCGTFSFFMIKMFQLPDHVVNMKTFLLPPHWFINSEILHYCFTALNCSLGFQFTTSEVNPYNQETPRSQCSENCPRGSRKMKDSKKPICCYDCVLCPEGEISNMTDSEECIKCLPNEWSGGQRDQCFPKLEEFLAFSDGLSLALSSIAVIFWTISVLIFGIYVSHKNTPVVKANNKNLSFILLISLSMCFLCVFLFIGRPVDRTCKLRQIVFGVIFSVCLSSVFAKTIMVYMAFKISRSGSPWKKLIAVKVSSSIVVLVSSVEVIISVVWLYFSPPYLEQDTQSYQRKVVIQCNEGSQVGFFALLGYLFLLASISFIVAYLARTLPDRFNEAKYITFSMLVFCSVWITMVPTYLSTKGKNMVAVEIFSILASSAGLLSFIFFPKCYIILIKPQMKQNNNYIHRATN
ncbi:vomeronasal type-2 receptor 26-like [Engystomops pustulosus]|uniref:vomeronasal type-2 receptor 26-like n=1 Tax=Engystomops pustulosus TaxID=76066 RepID=UPI003AFA8C9A